MFMRLQTPSILTFRVCFIAPLQVALNGSSTDTVGYGERVYFQFPFPTYGVTIQLGVTSGTVVCYASDRYQNPNEEQGYDWRVETSGYVDVFLDPSLLSYSAGSIVYVAIEGTTVTNTFALGNMEGDRRGIAHYIVCTNYNKYTLTLYHYFHFVLLLAVPTTLASNTAASNTVGMGERVYYQFMFPSTGITIQLYVGGGYIVCYASDSPQNPNERQGYDWKVESNDYIDTFIDPTLLGRPPGENVYISLEGRQVSNSFTVNSTSGDRRGETTTCFQPAYSNALFT